MGAAGTLPGSSAAGRAAAAALRAKVAGSVSTTPLTRWLYSTDASGYRVLPDAVLVAGAVEDLAVAAEVAAEHGVPLCLRGAGTSLAGQAIGPGIMVDCFKLDRILSIDAERRVATVEPGVIQASLNRAAAADGLEFGPDTSTVDQATIGGMVGNNSSGSRSIVYGQTVDKVLGIDAVLAGGEEARFGPCAGPDLASGVAGSVAERLARELAAIRDRSRERIATGYPRTSRCTSGYNLRELLAPQPNLARMLAGSEGTLALFTRLEVQLDPRPALRVGAALTFATLRAALEANVAILASGPSAVELLDLDPLRRAPNLSKFTRLAPLLAGGEPAMLTVEYQGEPEEAHAGLARLRLLASEIGASHVMYLDEPAALAEAGALRRAALPLLMGAPGAERPASFVEDTAVAPERLAEFVADFQSVVAGHGVKASFTGHASAGCLHIRPLLDLKTAAGIGKLEAIAHDVGRLVLQYHGAISGEHGCGRSRSWFLPELFGPGAVRGVRGPQTRLRPAGSARSRLHRRRPRCRRRPALRPLVPQRRRLAAAPELGGRGRLRPGHRALLRRRSVQEGHRHHVSAGGGEPRRGTHDARARQRPAGTAERRLRTRPALGRRDARRAGHVCGLQGLQGRVPCRGRHGGPEGRVAG